MLHPGVLVPHVSSLLPGITAGLVESQPEVREVCARALAGMVQGMGGQPVYELLPKLEALQEAMTQAHSAADREKAHQVRPRRNRWLVTLSRTPKNWEVCTPVPGLQG